MASPAAALLADQPPPPEAAAPPSSASSSSISSDSPDDEGFETASDPESDSAAPDAGFGTPEAAAPAAGAEDSAPAAYVRSGGGAEAAAGSGEGESGAGGAVETTDAVVDPVEAESVIVDGAAAEQETDGGEKIGAVADDGAVGVVADHQAVAVDGVAEEEHGEVETDVVGAEKVGAVADDVEDRSEAAGVVAEKDGEKIAASAAAAAAAVVVGERDVVGEEIVVPDEAAGAGLEKVAGKAEENGVADEAVDSESKAAASAVTVDGAVDAEGGKDGDVEAVASREIVGSEAVQVEGVKDADVEVVDSGKVLEDKPVEVEGVKGGDAEVVDSGKNLEDKAVVVEGEKDGDVEVVDSGKVLEDKPVEVEGVKGGDAEVVDLGKILEDKAVVVEGEKDEYVEANDSGKVLDDKPKLQLAEADSSAVDGSDESIKEVVESPVVDGGLDQAPVASELEAVGTVDVVEKIDAVENPIENGLESARDATQVDQNAALVGLKEAADSKEETVTGDSGKIEATDIADSNQGLEMIDGSKAVEVEGVKGGDVDAAVSEETIEEVAKLQTSEVESNLVDSEETGLDSGDVSDRGIKEGGSSVATKDFADKLDVSDENVGLVAIEVDDKVTSSDGGSGSADSEVAKDFVEKHEILNEHDAVDGVAPVKQEIVDERADIESNELESSPVTAEETQTREVEPISAVEREAVADFGGAYTAVAVAADDDDEKLGKNEAEEAGEENDGSISGSARVAILESSETAKQMIKEMEEGSSSASYHSDFRSSGENSHHLDGQIVTDSEEEGDTDDEGEGRELFDSAALTALLKAATGASSDGSITITPEDATRIFSVNRPTGLGSSVPSLKPAPSRTARPSPLTPSDATVVALPENNMPEEEKKLQEKVEQIRVKFLRLVQRLGHSPEDTVAAQVLYRLGLAEGIRHGRQISRLFSIENAKKKALQLEEDGNENLDFCCNILVLGKTGVGKSATINSIFGEGKSGTSSFEPATTSVRQISGIVDGVKIHVLDTPGLKTSVMDQAANRKILLAIKKQTKRCPPDIVLYVDRMDTQTRDLNDLPLLRSITSILGSSIWFNAIVALTHAASAPPDGPNGSPLSYEVFIAQRSHVVQHSIRQAAGDMRLMNPVALVENHPSCRRNREGERVLPNGLSWRPQLLLLCYSSKILSEANALLKLQDPSPGKLFGFRLRSPPLPYLLSSLLQSKTHPKLAADQGGDGDSDIDLDDVSDIDQDEEDDEYEQLPPFKPLRKSQIAKLTKEQKRAYLDEYDYRVKLLQKKQWKDELKRMKEMKKKGKNPQDDLAYGDMPEDFDQEGAPASVPVPLPDMVLPPTFDAENPVYRYRLLEPTSEFRTRPASESHLDHDCGYDGVSIEENLAIAGRFPAGIAIQITKDKNDFNLHVDSSISAKHGENGSTLTGFDIQQIGKQLAYVLRGETKFKNLKKNKTAAGVSVTFLGETVAAGMKIEDQLSIGNRVGLVATTGAIRSQGDMAYGANLEARLKDKDYPIGQALTTLGLSLMKWRSDLALGANLQSQFSVGRSSKMAVRVGLNNKLTGQVTVRTSTSEQLQIALLGILPLAVAFYRRISSGESYVDQ